MRWSSAISKKPRYADALEDALDAVVEQLHGHPPHLAVVFASREHVGHSARIGPDLLRRWPGVQVLGCIADGVIGAGVEVESEAALSVTAAVLPDVGVQPFLIRSGNVPASVDHWRRAIGVDPLMQPSFVVLADPYFGDVDDILVGLGDAYAGAPVVGGLASGGRGPGSPPLLCGDRVHGESLVGVALYGDLRLHTVVAQGCRPIGPAMTVTRADGHLLLELDGLSPVEALQGLLRALDPGSRDVFRNGPLVGILPGDATDGGRGDWLVRNVLGIDRRSRGLAVGASIRPGSRVQFQLRDAAASADELRSLLVSSHRSGPDPTGALLFSCVGRGRGFYGEGNHDSRCFAEEFGSAPLGGFFCNGEIGPIRGRNYLHGYTSAFGLFAPRPWN